MNPEMRKPGTTPAHAITQTSVSILPSVDAARKRTAHLQAVAALTGIALHRLDGGGWLASRWNLCRELDDHEIVEWLRRQGVQA